jgi:hypothetical protein
MKERCICVCVCVWEEGYDCLLVLQLELRVSTSRKSDQYWNKSIS